MPVNPLHQRLKEARKKKKLTQKSLGLSINVEENSAGPRITHYEKGRYTPDFQTLYDIAKILSVPVPYFYCEDDTLAEIVCLIEALDEKEKKELLTSLKKGSKQ